MANVVAAIGRRAKRTRAALAIAAAVLAGACAEPSHLIGLNVTGTEYSYSLGQPAHLWARAVYSDGVVEDVTMTADWASSATSIATVTREYDRIQVDFAVPGSVVVTVTYEDVSASVTLTVPSP